MAGRPLRLLGGSRASRRYCMLLPVRAWPQPQQARVWQPLRPCRHLPARVLRSVRNLRNGSRQCRQQVSHLIASFSLTALVLCTLGFERIGEERSSSTLMPGTD
jgi:hypothetical protein